MVSKTRKYKRSGKRRGRQRTRRVFRRRRTRQGKGGARRRRTRRGKGGARRRRTRGGRTLRGGAPRPRFIADVSERGLEAVRDRARGKTTSRWGIRDRMFGDTEQDVSASSYPIGESDDGLSAEESGLSAEEEVALGHLVRWIVFEGRDIHTDKNLLQLMNDYGEDTGSCNDWSLNVDGWDTEVAEYLRDNPANVAEDEIARLRDEGLASILEKLCTLKQNQRCKWKEGKCRQSSEKATAI